MIGEEVLAGTVYFGGTAPVMTMFGNRNRIWRSATRVLSR